jgi:hypothetical protein
MVITMYTEARFETSQGEQVIADVTVTAVRTDGTFGIKWPSGEMPDCSPGYVRLYDENGTEVQLTVEPQPPQMTLEMYEALQILLGGE